MAVVLLKGKAERPSEELIYRGVFSNFD